jgi:competence protein ComEC
MWKDKPALFAALVMIAGFLAGRYSGVPMVLWRASALVCFLSSLVVLIRSRSTDPRAVLSSASCTMLLFCASSLWYLSAVEYQPDHISRYLGIRHPVRVYCRIADEPRVRDGRTSVLVNVEALTFGGDSAAIGGNALLTIVADRRADEHPQTFSYGDLITFETIPEEPPDTRNPGEVSYREYLAINNIFAVLRVIGYHTIAHYGERSPNWFFESIIFPSRHFVSRTIHSTLHGEDAHYLTGLLLGDRSDISKEIQTAFANTGTMHVLAVSGSHVVIIVVAIYALFSLIRLPRRVKSAATIAAIMFYMFLTGATPSVVRASLMASVVLAGKLFQRRSSVYNSLGISAILMFLYDPKQLFDVGFQLSFAAVLSMVYFYPKLTSWTHAIPTSWRKFGIVPTAAELFGMSAAAQIGTIPFTAFYFGKVSLISFIANLCVVPLAGFNISLGFVATLFSLLSEWAGSCVNEVNAVLAQSVLASVKAANQVPFAIIHTASFGMTETVLYACAVAVLFNLTRPVFVRRMLLVLIMLGDCLLLERALAAPSHRLRVTFFDVGQGDAALVEFPDGASLLFDAGPRTETAENGRRVVSYDAGEKVIVPALRRKGIDRPSAVVVTHPHDDHIGGMPFLLKECGAGLLIESTQRSVSAAYASYAAARSGRSTRCVVPGDTLLLDPSVRVYILHPSQRDIRNDTVDAYTALNNSSIVCKICYGGVSFLMMGDVERIVEDDLTDRYGGFLRSSVIKIGHHGSGTSSSEAFLNAAAAREAVISVGRFNKFRHPSKIVVQRLHDRGIALHRTDRDGAVVFETDGTTLFPVQWR